MTLHVLISLSTTVHVHICSTNTSQNCVPDKGQPSLNPLCTSFLELAALYKSIFEDALR